MPAVISHLLGTLLVAALMLAVPARVTGQATTSDSTDVAASLVRYFRTQLDRNPACGEPGACRQGLLFEPGVTALEPHVRRSMRDLPAAAVRGDTTKPYVGLRVHSLTFTADSANVSMRELSLHDRSRWSELEVSITLRKNTSGRWEVVSRRRGRILDFVVPPT